VALMMWFFVIKHNKIYYHFIRAFKSKQKGEPKNSSNISVSGSGNCTFLKISLPSNLQKGAISATQNLHKA
jgi:hypothetical protein